MLGSAMQASNSTADLTPNTHNFKKGRHAVNQSVVVYKEDNNTSLLSPQNGKTRNNVTMSVSISKEDWGVAPDKISAKALSPGKLHKAQIRLTERLHQRSDSPLSTKSFYTNKWCTKIYKDKYGLCCCCPHHAKLQLQGHHDVSFGVSPIKETFPAKSLSPKKKQSPKKKRPQGSKKQPRL